MKMSSEVILLKAATAIHGHIGQTRKIGTDTDDATCTVSQWLGNEVRASGLSADQMIWSPAHPVRLPLTNVDCQWGHRRERKLSGAAMGHSRRPSGLP